MKNVVVAGAAACVALAAFRVVAPTCCNPTLRWTPQSYTYKFTYDAGVSQQERTDFENRTASGSGRWNDMFDERNDGTTVTADAQGTITIEVSANHNDLQWSCDPTCGTEGAHTVIEVPLEWVDGTKGETDVIVDMQHEFGHRLGYEQDCTCDSLMGDPCQGVTDFTSCDLEMFDDDIGPVDTDGDGYSPNSDPPDQDCDDSNDQIYPGAWNPHCQNPESMDTEEDWDCSGVPDVYEEWCSPTPIVVDVLGNGFGLTSRAEGVQFDWGGNGVGILLSWTSAGSDDAWLVLDRDGNGVIGSSLELFSNVAPQPTQVAKDRNGFRALAVFDTPEAGGNANNWIDPGDAVFGGLRLWQDRNHDGWSQADELMGLTSAGIQRISLDFRESRRQDRSGNWFRYRAKVDNNRNRDGGPWAYDVYLGTWAERAPHKSGGKQPNP